MIMPKLRSSKPYRTGNLSVTMLSTRVESRKQTNLTDEGDHKHNGVFPG
jgi:hypothetical protein